MSSEEYEDMFLKQDGKCAICSRTYGHKSKKGNEARLAVDHCHDTDKIRGLLCNRCNRGIGLFQDNITLFEKAILYLKSTSRGRSVE
jgi:hypothetical protein